jgi:hypothetical protein
MIGSYKRLQIRSFQVKAGQSTSNHTRTRGRRSGHARPRRGVAARDPVVAPRAAAMSRLAATFRRKLRRKAGFRRKLRRKAKFRRKLRRNSARCGTLGKSFHKVRPKPSAPHAPWAQSNAASACLSRCHSKPKCEHLPCIKLSKIGRSDVRTAAEAALAGCGWCCEVAVLQADLPFFCPSAVTLNR